MTCFLMQMVLMEEGTFCNFTWLWINNSSTNHSFSNLFETNTFQTRTHWGAQFRNWFTVDICQYSNIHELICMIVKKNMKCITEFLKIRSWYVHVFDFKIIINLEHEDFTNWINSFEHRQIPTTVKCRTYFPNES